MKRLTVTFYKDNNKKWRWNLKSANGKIIAESGEGYDRFEGAMHGFGLVQDFAMHAKQVKMDGQTAVVLFDPDSESL